MRGDSEPQGPVATHRVWRSFAFAILVALLVVATGAAASPTDTTWTVAGTGVMGDDGDGGQARAAAIDQPRSVSWTPGGGFVWAEPYSHRVRIVDANGIVRTLAGTGEAGFGGDGGPAAEARLDFVHAAVPTADGGFLLDDSLNNRIRKISSSGIISTVAGTGQTGYGGDGGPATRAEINHPRGVVALSDGGFLIPDSNNHRVRRVSASGTITTVAGTGAQGFSGDGGQATSAQLSIPFAVAPTADGGFLIADIGNQRIRKVSSAGVITTVAGNGLSGFSGDGGPATAASLRDPHDLVALAGGGFLIADTSNERVRRVDANGVISTLIGDGVRGASGDGGAAAAARLAAPKGLSLTGAGDLLIADEQNNRIRFVGTIVAPLNTVARTWLVRVSASLQRAGEYTVRAGNSRLADAIAAYGRPSCKVVGPRQAVATWPSRGIRIDSRTTRALPRGKSGCSAPQLMNVAEIRLTDRRWTTSLGLHVGDATSKLRKLYGRVLYARASRPSSRNEYYLVWRHGKCISSCTKAAKRNGVDYPRLTAQVKNGKVIAFRIPVLAQGK
jgi:hypothetical protein